MSATTRTRPRPAPPGLPARIRARRLALGLDQYELAAECGTVRWTVGRWEAGVDAPSARTLPGLADALGCSIDWLLRGEVSPCATD